MSRQESLLLDSHLLSYEALVGTLTKQVLAQQEQLSELRDLLTSQQHSTSSYRLDSSVPSPARERHTNQPVHQVDDHDIVDSPAPYSSNAQATIPAVGRSTTTSRSQIESVVRQLEPIILDVLSRHLIEIEQRLAESLVERIRRITKQHVMASAEKEIRRLVRDAVVMKHASPTHDGRNTKLYRKERDASTGRVTYGNTSDTSSTSSSDEHGTHLQSTQRPQSGRKHEDRLHHTHNSRNATARHHGEEQPHREPKARSDRDTCKATERFETKELKVRQPSATVPPKDQLLSDMSDIRSRLIDLENRSGASLSHSRPASSSGTSLLHSAAQRRMSVPHKNVVTRHDASLSTTSGSESDVSDESGSFRRRHETAAKPTHSLSSTRGSLHDVDRDVDDLLQKFHKLCGTANNSRSRNH